MARAITAYTNANSSDSSLLYPLPSWNAPGGDCPKLTYECMVDIRIHNILAFLQTSITNITRTCNDLIY